MTSSWRGSIMMPSWPKRCYLVWKGRKSSCSNSGEKNKTLTRQPASFFFNCCDYTNIPKYLEKSEIIQNHVGGRNDVSTNGHINDNYIQDMVNFRNQNPENLITGHLNINGLRNKSFKVYDRCLYMIAAYLRNDLPHHRHFTVASPVEVIVFEVFIYTWSVVLFLSL